ncbi:hypothetical protein CHS0354_016634 [Potamilus streckersoni]|uniref:Uncharacterized protein n=1 Tax=Potamilus streckersoni TaxID=2493646 RepID=A0AAE0TI92_9BIVA|nr:hypothetical protein CHS0354_016634 [Potamilus streckersoni]
MNRELTTDSQKKSILTAMSSLVYILRRETKQLIRSGNIYEKQHAESTTPTCIELLPMYSQTLPDDHGIIDILFEKNKRKHKTDSIGRFNIFRRHDLNTSVMYRLEITVCLRNSWEYVVSVVDGGWNGREYVVSVGDGGWNGRENVVSVGDGGWNGREYVVSVGDGGWN